MARPTEYTPLCDIWATTFHVEDAGQGALRVLAANHVAGENRACAALVMTPEIAKALAEQLDAANHCAKSEADSRDRKS